MFCFVLFRFVAYLSVVELSRKFSSKNPTKRQQYTCKEKNLKEPANGKTSTN